MSNDIQFKKKRKPIDTEQGYCFCYMITHTIKVASRFQVRIVSRETRANSLTVTFMCQRKKDNPHPVKIEIDSSP